MFFPSFCEKDPNGPVSQIEALALIEEMRNKYAEKISETQIIGKTPEESDRRRSFDHACGAEQALHWVYDLVQRIIPDPSYVRQNLIENAQYLEDHARHLRAKAMEPDGRTNQTG